jgi:hypothetical protein
MPADLKRALASDPQALTAWEDITPPARNEWICWIESPKKAETRSRRIEWGCSSLNDGRAVGLDAPTAKPNAVKLDNRDRGLEAANLLFVRQPLRALIGVFLIALICASII